MFKKQQKAEEDTKHIPVNPNKAPPVHGLSLNVSEPDPQIWSEVLSRQLQHGDIPAAV